jgi:hypothetical protein
MFISVKEAAELTGKSATTIYRLCNKRINTEYVRKEDNKFLIDKEFLMATYPVEEEEELIVDIDELPEMRFENVLETENVEINVKEKPVFLEKSEPVSSNNELKIENELKTGATIEFEEKLKKSYFRQLSSNEVLAGLLISLGLVAVFIYLLFVLSK